MDVYKCLKRNCFSIGDAHGATQENVSALSWCSPDPARSVMHVSVSPAPVSYVPVATPTVPLATATVGSQAIHLADLAAHKSGRTLASSSFSASNLTPVFPCQSARRAAPTHTLIVSSSGTCSGERHRERERESTRDAGQHAPFDFLSIGRCRSEG